MTNDITRAEAEANVAAAADRCIASHAAYYSQLDAASRIGRTSAFVAMDIPAFDAAKAAAAAAYEVKLADEKAYRVAKAVLDFWPK